MGLRYHRGNPIRGVAKPITETTAAMHLVSRSRRPRLAAMPAVEGERLLKKHARLLKVDSGHVFQGLLFDLRTNLS